MAHIWGGKNGTDNECLPTYIQWVLQKLRHCQEAGGKSSFLLGQTHVHEGAMEPDTFFLERNFQKMGSTLFGGGGGET